MNQQRQTTPATIDLTPAHQVLRARVMGAIDCHPRFRVKSLNSDGDRTTLDPFSIGSDTIANQCAASDLLVSFNGSHTYMLQCEVKTTREKFGDRTAPEIFRDIKHVEYSDSGKRNLRQFGKLCGGGSHYWWYVIAQVHGLNEDDQDLLESKIGDQPAILIEGKAPYPEAIRQYGPMRLNTLLKEVRRRVGCIGDELDGVYEQASTSRQPMLFQAQQEMVFDSNTDSIKEQPKDPLIYLKKAPLKRVIQSSQPLAPRQGLILRDEHVETCLEAIAEINVPLETFIKRMTEREMLAHEAILAIVQNGKGVLEQINEVRALVPDVAAWGSVKPVTLSLSTSVLKSDVGLLSLAVEVIKAQDKVHKGRTRSSRHSEVFEELRVPKIHGGERKNLANLLAQRFFSSR